MRSFFFALSVAVLGCSTSSSDATTPAAASTPADATPAERGDLEVAYFAGGCFWGVEHYMEQLDGVVSVESGYMGGAADSPTYEQVSYEETGHLETVRVRFDPARIDYEAVAKRFFEIHDPTQADGQGPDVGSQYLSAVFYTGPEQKQATDKLIGQLKARGYDVVTAVRPAASFWEAEAYHQDHYRKTGQQPYCHSRVRRFGD